MGVQCSRSVGQSKASPYGPSSKCARHLSEGPRCGQVRPCRRRGRSHAHPCCNRRPQGCVVGHSLFNGGHRNGAPQLVRQWRQSFRKGKKKWPKFCGGYNTKCPLPRSLVKPSVCSVCGQYTGSLGGCSALQSVSRGCPGRWNTCTGVKVIVSSCVLGEVLRVRHAIQRVPSLRLGLHVPRQNGETRATKK